MVVSDCWGAYNGLDQVCRHYTVNHSKKFVNEKGYHTNGAESVHNTIKYWVRLQHYNFGATTLELQRNVALQCVNYGDTHNGREQSWQSRFVRVAPLCVMYIVVSCLKRLYCENIIDT